MSTRDSTSCSAGRSPAYRFASRGGEREAWSTALYALTRAKFHPRGDKTEEARSALRRLAFAAGALVTITRRRTFSPERGERVVELG